MTTDNLIAHARTRFNHASARKQLKEKYEAKLLFAHNGGMFRASPELLAFVAYWPIDELFMEDLYGNPIKVDKQAFLVTAQQHYHIQMNAWHNEYESQQKIR